MSIETRIQAINDHLIEDYKVLQLAGAGLTGVNKNIVNLKMSWKERLLYFMNNGTDEVWNNWDKVNGSGTSLSLNNTEEAPMSLIYKGNTSQETSTQGNQLIPFINQDFTINGIRFYAQNGNLYTNGTSTTYISSLNQDFQDNLSFTLPAGTYYMDRKTTGLATYLYDITDTSTTLATNSGSFTLSQTTTVFLGLYVGKGVARDNAQCNVMVNTGNTSKTYESFIPNMPSPNYPSTIKTVSGDNSIDISNGDNTQSSIYPISLGVLGKNLFNGKVEQGAISQNNGQTYEQCKTSNATRIRTIDLIKLDTNKSYTISIKSGYSYVIQGFNNEGKLYDIGQGTWKTTATTITNVPYIALAFKKPSEANITPSEIDSLEVMLEEGTSASTYEKYNPLELLHIPSTDYYDKIDKSSGKNLFDYQDLTSKIQTFTTSGTANNFTLVGYGTYQYPISISTNEIISGSWSTTNLNGDVKAIYEDDTNANIFSSYTSSSASGTISFIPTKKVKAIQFRTSNSNNNITLNNFMINEGSTALPYEPYGTGWYLKKEIGKVVLNGTQTTVYAISTTGKFYYTSSLIKDIAVADTGVICQNLKGVSYGELFSSSDNYLISQGGGAAGSNRIVLKNIYDNGTLITTSANLATWLSNNNVTVYYILATPTYEPITDTTLLGQLEAIKKSYESQTNISQEYNDLPFELSVVALRQEL